MTNLLMSQTILVAKLNTTPHQEAVYVICKRSISIKNLDDIVLCQDVSVIIPMEMQSYFSIINY